MTLHRERTPFHAATKAAFLAAWLIGGLLVPVDSVVAAGGVAALPVTKTANPTTYTAAGQTIAYTDVVRDYSTDPADFAIDIAVSDDKVSGLSVDAVPDQATAPVIGPFSTNPSWTLSKTASPTSYAAAGETISYSYVLANTGDVSISGITVSDDKVTTVTCPSTTLAAGASATCTGSYTTTAADVTAGSVTNTATAHGTPSSGTLGDVTATATVTFAAHPSWTLSKTASPTSYAAAGETITYSYTLTNTGNVSIWGITVSDDKVTAVTCPVMPHDAGGALPSGGSFTCTGSYTTTSADVAAGSVTNTATAHGTPSGGTLGDATANATVTFTANPSWTLSKTASPTSYAAAGETITYSYTLTNTGNVSISGITVSDDKVTAVTCPVMPHDAGGALPSGGSFTCTGSYTTTSADVAAGSVTNTATAHGTPSSGTLGDATANATVTLTANPSWTLSKTASPTSYAAAGETITYSYTLTNTGNVSISGITVSDDKVTTVTCAATTLPVGASATCSGTYTTTSADATAGSVTNTATAHGTPSSGTLGDVTATATVTLAGHPSWTLHKTASPTIYTGAGQTITYRYALTNTGNVSISGITVADDTVGTVTCPATTLAVGASTTCSGSYTTTAADVEVGGVTNRATAHGTPSSGTLGDATATATVTFVAYPSWTLSKTASPATYSGAGQTITYSYALSNTGNVSISAITVSDDKVGTVTCPATTLAVGASTTCSGSYTTTTADVEAGRVTNTATATGTPSRGTLAAATATATVTYKPPPTGSITIVTLAAGGNSSFPFTSSVSGAAQFDLATVNGTATRAFPGLPPGTYTFAEGDLPLHWKLSSLTCAGDAGGRGTTTDVSGRAVSVGLDGGEAITCTFANEFDVALHRTLTLEFIHNFLGRRLRLLAAGGPGPARFVRRMPGSLWGHGTQAGGAAGPAGPFTLSGDTQPLSSMLSFSTSTSQIRRALGTDTASQAGGTPASNPRLNAWVEGHYQGFKDVDTTSDFGIVYGGADYLLGPSVLVGALVQRDWTTGKSRAAGETIGLGTGTMAGPYVSARLTPSLFVDARAAWGTSHNTIDPFGLYRDTFSTGRWLVNTQVTGNLLVGRFRVTPNLGLDYIEERQHSYTDSLGVLIPAQTVALGRFTFGPEIARRYQPAGGWSIEPELSLSGVWDFENPDVSPSSILYDGHAAVHVMIRGGLGFQRLNGVSIHITSGYDGIGTGSFKSYGAQVWLNVPLK